MKKLFGLLMILTIALSGCSKPKVDTSSDETMKASIAKVRESLPAAEREKFDEAVKIIAFSELDIKSLFAMGTSGVNLTEAKVKQALNGKTGDDIIAQAEKIKKDLEEKKRVQALDEIKELEEKQTKAQNAKTELAKFKVVRSRFYKREQDFIGKEPIIELTVKNDTKYPVSHVYFKGTLSSPGRAVPWLREDFNYAISGGLEPGETAKWSLAPNMFSEWGRVEAPANAIFTVEVLRLDGADGKELFSSMGFSEGDATRLSELKKNYKQ